MRTEEIGGGCFDNELNLFGANILKRMKRFLFREKKKKEKKTSGWGRGLLNNPET